jgi:hypothetical protein
MRGLRLLGLTGAVAGVLIASSTVWAQANNGNNGGANNGGNNNNNNGGNNTNNNTNNIGSSIQPAGVIISAEGVFRVRPLTDKTGALTRTRMAESRSRLGGEVAKGSSLRKISLQRLEAALAERLSAGKQPTDEMRALAGLTRLQYVFYYPETRDIVIAGPAEGFFPDLTGRVLGLSSGRAVLELQDLVAALRAFPSGGKQHHTIAVSIDPSQEGLARMNQYLRSIRPGPGDAPAIVEGLKQSQGLHNVTITGVSPRTHFAQVLVEADYRMKLIGIGIEPPPVRMITYIDRAAAGESLQRWYFVPNYECIKASEDELAMELVGQGVKLVGAGEVVAATGERSAAGHQSKASTIFCRAFTDNYAKIATAAPVYGQLKNLVDLAIAAAYIQRQDYYGQADWKAEILGDERQFAIETFETPKTVEPACTAVWKGNRLFTPIGGGVVIEALEAVQPKHRLKDEKGTVKEAHDGVKLSDLPNGQWWWD